MAIDKLQDDSAQKSYSYSRRKLYFSAIVAALLFTIVGLFMGWPSPALVLLKPRNFTASQTTLLASLPNLAPGPLITMFGIDLIGRKPTLFVIWSTLFSSYVIMLISENINALLIARFIGGWGMGAAFSAIGIYISEISDVHIRGPLNSISMIFFLAGSIIISSVGPFTSIQVISIVSFAVSLLFGIFFWFIPESPYHEINKGQIDKARSSLLWLRENAREEDIEDELNKIQFAIEEEKKQKVGIRKIFTSKAVWKQFGIAWYILYLQQLSGLGPISAYALTIFEAANLSFKAAYVPIALNIFGLVAGMPTPYLVKKFGNKKLFIAASLGIAAGQGILAAYFFLLEGGHDISSITWLPLFGMAFYYLFAFIGYGGLVWATISDLFAPSVKGYATGISGIFSTFLGFVVTEIFGLSQDKYHLGTTFMGLCVILLISSFGLIFVPDTTKMSLQEIQDYFEGKNKKKREEELRLQ